MSGTVVVLTPNGRRQTVKVTPNTTLLQILEEACHKQGFKAELYNLIFHRKVLDVTLTVRFAGLPNNCVLELSEAEVARPDSEVTVGVQTEDGKRVMGEFNPAVSVETVLKSLCPNELKLDTVVIYMRNEICGNDLKTKTLKALGITSGRAMLRLMHRNLEALKTQANVSTPLPSKPVEEKPYKRQFQPVEFNEAEPTQQNTPQTLVPSSVRGESTNHDTGSSADNHEELKRKQPQRLAKNDDLFDKLRQEKRKQTEGLKIKSQPQKRESPPASMPTTGTKDLTKNDFIFLGARNAMLFSFETAQAVASDDLPDDFFELSITDVKKLFRDIKQRRLDLEGGKLMTSAMRELEANRKQLRALNQYRKAVIRVKFPDQLVLQGVFKPTETVQHVVDFVREYVNDKTMDFYLFTAPPKTILDGKLNLIEAECVPGALLHFGSDEKRQTYLRRDILDKVVSNTSAATAASKTRNENMRSPPRPKEEDIDISEYLRPENNAPTSTSSESSDYEPRFVPQRTEKLPKWFKPSK